MKREQGLGGPGRLHPQCRMPAPCSSCVTRTDMKENPFIMAPVEPDPGSEVA